MRGTERTPRRDHDAADLLRELREERHIGRREMPREMLRAGVPRDHIPCVRTLARIEDEGAIPIERFRFGLAQFFDRPVRAIWNLSSRDRVAA